MVAASYSATLVPTQITLHHNPEHNMNIYHCENFQFHTILAAHTNVSGENWGSLDEEFTLVV
jgi:hypothetical protein